MSPELVQRYQRGGDIWASLAAQYGEGAADRVARVAATSRDRIAVNDEIERLQFGPARNDSTLSNFGTYLVTDPFGAPLDAANERAATLFKNTALALLRNPYVLGGLLFAAALYLMPYWLPLVTRRRSK